MIHFFEGKCIYAIEHKHELKQGDISKLEWLLGGAKYMEARSVSGFFIGPRKEMITPWSTNAVEMTRNMGIEGISRMEEFFQVKDSNADYDPMLQALYKSLAQDIFTIDRKPEALQHITNIAAYNQKEGLALSADEIGYLEDLSKRIGRPLTDSEVFGFSQVNSEHCRHKIFNGTFIIDGEEKPETLFSLIRKTSKTNPNQIISAYKDNVAFIAGPKVEQFAPARQDIADYFRIREIESVISLKAETHNFPTTVEPFNGAATGSGGEIRDRMAGGKGSLPLAGTAVYMTSYPRMDEKHPWVRNIKPRKWLYHTPEDILIKASNGASDFGNKFGQPLICGSLLTFEHAEPKQTYGYDKVIMLAGGVGFGRKEDSLKSEPEPGDQVIVLGGDNYRIGMGATILFSEIMKAGLFGVLQAVIIVLSVWYFAFWIAKKLKVDAELGAMLASAVSICGVSAAIATAGAIKGDSKKLSYVISLVLIVAIPMMIIMPLLSRWMGLTPEVTGAWIGGTIDTTGAVVAGGTIAGDIALKFSTIIKFSQNVLLGVAAFIISIYWTYKKSGGDPAEKPSLKLIWERFPKFVLGFIATSIIFSFFINPETAVAAGKTIKSYQSLWFNLAFVCIGLETRFKDLITMDRGRPAYAFLIAQGFNIILTLIVAYVLFGILWQ